MKIAIVGGKNKAKYLIAKFKNKKNTIVYITQDENFARQINRDQDIDVYCGDGTSLAVMRNAEIEDFDLFIALCPKDEDNLVACRLAKFLNVKRTLSIITNPMNNEIFRKLQVDTTVSIANIISMIIEKNAFTQNIDTLLPIQDGKALILEIEIESRYTIVGKPLMETKLPEECLVSCIIRDNEPVIPRGSTIIEAGDRLVVLSLSSAQEKVIRVITNA